MPHFRFAVIKLTRYPHTNETLLAIALWPVLFAIGCWRTPQIAQFLNSQGVEISMLQVFLAGFGGYLILLDKHRMLNHRYFEYHAVHITWYRRLCKVDQDMVAAGLAGTDAHSAVTIEMALLRKQLGFLVDAENFYRKLKVLTCVMSCVRGNLK